MMFPSKLPKIKCLSAVQTSAGAGMVLLTSETETYKASLFLAKDGCYEALLTLTEADGTYSVLHLERNTARDEGAFRLTACLVHALAGFVLPEIEL